MFKRKPHLLIMSIAITIILISGCTTKVDQNESTSTPQIDEATTSEQANTNDAPNENETTDASTKEETNMQPLIIPSLTISQKALPDLEAINFVNDMGLGWNLGNTFDAVDNNAITNGLDYESTWSGTLTTKKMLEDIRSAGFKTLRIPVSWHNHVTGDNHLIDQAWLDRVTEVVDWAMELDFYVIINMHHDIAPEWVFPNSEYYESSSLFATSVWKQISEQFINYDEKLIFEAQNEPRIKGADYEWWPNEANPECVDAMKTVNLLNQDILDTIRSTGGNNANRYVLIPGYVASPAGALSNEFVLPTDSATDRLIVSVHSYSPYPFALMPDSDGNSTDVFQLSASSSTSPVSSFMNDLYNRFVSQGIPVVIGEFGSVNRNENTQARIDHAAYYVAEASANGIRCIWWDNNILTGNGERFCLYKRESNTFPYPLIIEAMIKYTF